VRAASNGRVMRHDHNGHSIRVEAIDQRDDLFAGRLVELTGWFVGQKQARPIGDRSRDRDPLHLAARKF
jgi:hypothetical protein